jgi:diacylglycerol kinase family enzyme
MILAGNCRQLDAGRANGQLFLVMASCGFDADVVQRLHSNRDGHIRHWSYAKPVISSIKKYKYPKIRIRLESADGKKQTATSRWAFTFNVPRYAMNLPIIPDADPEDGELDLCTFRGGNLFRGLYYLFAVLMRMRHSWTTSKTFRFVKLTMESDGEVPYQLDGDPGGVLPLEIEVVSSGVTVIVP